jgi:hypothetical protein
MCASLVSFGDFVFLFWSLFSVAHWTTCLAIVFGQIDDEWKWELGDGEAACFCFISLFLSVCWLEKLMLGHGAFVVVLDLEMYTTYDRNKYYECCYRITCCACVCFYSLSFVTLFYCEECKFVVSIMTWMVTIPAQEPVVRDSAAQTSNGKLMSADPQIFITCSFCNPEGSISYTSADISRIMADDSIYGEEGLGVPSTKS